MPVGPFRNRLQSALSTAAWRQRSSSAAPMPPPLSRHSAPDSSAHPGDDAKRAEQRRLSGAQATRAGPACEPFVPAARETPGYLLESWLDYHADLTPEQRSAILGSAFALHEQTMRTLVEVRGQFELYRRKSTSVRGTLEARLGEALAEQSRLAEQVRLLEEAEPDASAAAETVAEAVQEALERERADADADDNRRSAESRFKLERAPAGEEHAELVARLAGLECERASWADEREQLGRVQAQGAARIAELERAQAAWAEARDRLDRERAQAADRIAQLEHEKIEWREERAWLEAEKAEAAARTAELECERVGWAGACERASAAERAAVADSEHAAGELADARARIGSLERERLEWAEERAQLVCEVGESAAVNSALVSESEQASAQLAAIEKDRERRLAEQHQIEEMAAQHEQRHGEVVARLFEVECEYALEKERWADERVRLEAEIGEAADGRECLERERARLLMDRDRLSVAKQSLETWLESMLQRHAVPETLDPGTVVPAAPVSPSPSYLPFPVLSDLPRAEPREAAPPGGPSSMNDDDRPDRPSAPAAHLGDEEEVGADEESLLALVQQRNVRGERRAQVGTVHAVLLVDEVEHLHGCFDPEEIPELIADLHRLEWLAEHRVAMGEHGRHPVLGEVGMPVPEFLFGVLPDFLLDTSDVLRAASEAQWETGARDAVEAQFEKLVKLHGVLNEFVGRALSERAVVIPAGLVSGADGWRTLGPEFHVDPLAALDALYEEVDSGYAAGDDGALEVIDRVVASSVWRDLDGVPLDALRQRKLLYLLLRLVNSAQVVLFEAFVRVQDLRRSGA